MCASAYLYFRRWRHDLSTIWANNLSNLLCAKKKIKIHSFALCVCFRRSAGALAQLLPPVFAINRENICEAKNHVPSFLVTNQPSGALPCLKTSKKGIPSLARPSRTTAADAPCMNHPQGSRHVSFCPISHAGQTLNLFKCRKVARRM